MNGDSCVIGVMVDGKVCPPGRGGKDSRDVK